MGALSKNNAKIGGLKLKLLLLQGGPNFHFMSCTFVLNCKNNSTCIVKQENDLRKCYQRLLSKELICAMKYL